MGVRAWAPFPILTALPGGGPGTRGGLLRETDGVVPSGNLARARTDRTHAHKRALPGFCSAPSSNVAVPFFPVSQANILGLAAGQRGDPS